MKAKPSQKPKRAKFRSNSYEASLTEKQRMSFYEMLLDDGLMLHQIQAKTASWPRGPEKRSGTLALSTLLKIRNRLRLEDMLFNLDGTSERLEAIKRLLGPMAKAANQEKLLDSIMTAISAEVIYRTMKGLNPEARTAATRLLLKRADQRRVDRRLDMLEADLKQDAPPAKTDIGLTPEEKKQRMREILHIN